MFAVIIVYVMLVGTLFCQTISVFIMHVMLYKQKTLKHHQLCMFLSNMLIENTILHISATTNWTLKCRMIFWCGKIFTSRHNMMKHLLLLLHPVINLCQYFSRLNWCGKIFTSRCNMMKHQLSLQNFK